MMSSQIVSPQLIPNGTSPLETQVAGHNFQPGTNAIGMLKSNHNGLVLKPLLKKDCGAREVSFYRSLENSTDSDLVELRNFVPEYKGTVKMVIQDRELEFIKLIDLTHEMSEPCIMDIKIGKRTWDPLATPEKIAVEEAKYAACKKTLGLSIPGFQVYNLVHYNETNGRDISDTDIANCLERYGKDYGKQLNENTLQDTLRMFLNFNVIHYMPLIGKILAELTLILKWCRKQTKMKLYASSILIVYDARRLRNFMKDNDIIKYKNSSLTPNGLSYFQADRKSPSDIINVNKKSPQTKQKNSFYVNNTYLPYNKNYKHEKLMVINNSEENSTKENHLQQNGDQHEKQNNITDKSSDESEKDDFSWIKVKMIDFAHAFPSEDRTIDTNYLFGIESLVRIFKEFLRECEHKEY